MVATPQTYGPAAHYDRVTAAWRLLLGEELHYGVFDSPNESLAVATTRLTDTMLSAAQISSGDRVLDVGCGTGAPAATIAARTGASVLGITTSPEGVERATATALKRGVDERVVFEQRDGMDNGLKAESFDRVWVLESSHLMRHRERLVAECSRVLRTGGRIALCDIILRRPMDLAEVRRLREPLGLLRRVFGDARMEPIARYHQWFREQGIQPDLELDLTDESRPTFDHWRQNAVEHEADVQKLIGEHDLAEFVNACEVLDGFWADGTLGYGLIAGTKA